MRLIGMIGGMSWESSLLYYKLVNEEVKARLGGLHSASCLLHSIDFAGIEAWQRQGEWDTAGAALARIARALQGAGAEALVLCTNTMHKVAAHIERAVGVPLLHIADSAGRAAQERGVRTAGLLGTRFTMEEEFYPARLRERFGVEVLTPDPDERQEVNRVIYEELCRGVLRPESRARFRAIAARLVERGAEGVILGCTEIGLLVGDGDATVPLFDTTRLHARAAVDFMLGSA